MNRQSARARHTPLRRLLAASCATLAIVAAGSALAQTSAAPGPNLICNWRVESCLSNSVVLGGIGFDQFARNNQTHTRIGGGSAVVSDFVGNRYSQVDGDRWADGSSDPYTERTIIYWDGTHGSSDWGTNNSTVGGLGAVANTSTIGERFLTSFNSFDSSSVSSNGSPSTGVPYVYTDKGLRLNIKDGYSTAFGVDATGYSLTNLAFSALTESSNVTINLGIYADGTTTATGRSLTVTGSTMNNGVAYSYYSFDLSGLGLDNGQYNLVLTYQALNGTFLVIDNIQIIGVVYDPASGMMVIWQGGDGTWGATPVNWGSTGGGTGAWTQGSFATFGGTPGTVTVSTVDGPVSFSGAEFLSSGYTITGDTLTTEGATIELRVSAASAATISAAITGTAGLQKTGDGTLILSGANSWEGATEVLAGYLRIDGNSSAVISALNVASGVTFGGVGSYGGAVTIANGGTLLMQSGSTLTLGGLTLNSGSILGATLGAPGATPLVQVNGDLTLDGTLNVTNGVGFGEGIYRLFNYTGALTDNGLDIGATPAGVLASELGLQTANAGEVNLVYAVTSYNFWQGGAGVWSADPAGTNWRNLDGTLSSPWLGDLAIFDGTGGAVEVDDAFGAVSFTGLQFADAGYSIIGDALVINKADTNIRVGDGSASGVSMLAEIASAITGSGGIVKNDLGTLILSGANTYTGTTQVAAGTLLVNGNSSAATGNVSVASGGSLGGSGTIGGDVSIANGGVLLGQSGQTLTTGSLALNNASQIGVTLGAPSTTALFQVNGDLTLDGVLNVTDTGSFGVGLYRLFDYTGSLTDNGLEIGLTPTGVRSRDLLVQTDQANRVNLVYYDSVTPLPNWTGGDGVWSVAPTPANWSNGSFDGGWRTGFALFQGEAGVVTIDTAAGAVEVTGMQFASDGYRVEGGALTTNTANTAIRVGDGTEASAGYRATIASTITGTGGIDKTDYGTLVLTGTNTYTGGTRISYGTLEVSSNANLGATSGTLTFDGGTLRTTAAFSSSRAVGFEDDGGVIDTGAFNITLSGVLSGNGDFFKYGTGVLTISGQNNTYTGLTSIAEGRIHLSRATASLADTIIGQGATLSGNGVIRGDLTNHGLLSPGTSPGTITVEGNFTQSAAGTYLVEIKTETDYDSLIVNGTANLAGTLEVTGLDTGTGTQETFTPTAGQSFTIITATGGVNGTFDTVVSDWDEYSAMLRFEASYEPNAVTVELMQLPYAGVTGASSNQSLVGAGIDGAIAEGTIDDLLAALNSLPTEAGVLDALSQLSPQRYERLFSQAVYNTAATISVIENRLAEVAADRHSGFWFEGAYHNTSFDATGDSTSAEGETMGFVLGGDLPITKDLQMGMMLAYASETLDLDEAGSAAEGERYSTALYGRYDLSPVILEASLGASLGKFDLTRSVAVLGYERVAEADTNTSETFASFRASYPVTFWTARLTPYAGVSYIDWKADGFVERSADQASLTLDDQEAMSLSSRLGVNLALPFKQGGITIAPTVDLSWRHEFEVDVRAIFGVIGGSTFVVNTAAAHSDGFAAALGVDVGAAESWTVYARVSGEWKTAVDAAVSTQVGVEFRF